MKQALSNVRAFCTRTGAAIGAVLLVPSVALAQATPTFDPTDTIAMVNDAKSFITTVGLAVLALIMLAKGIKWVRKAG
jgi:hypothetical protein